GTTAAARVMARRGDLAAVIPVSRSAGEPYLGGPEPCEIIHNGVDLDACRLAARAPLLRAELGLPDDAVVVGYAGRLVAHTGLEVLCDAWRLIRERVATAHLVILGGNPAGGSGVLAALRRRLGAGMAGGPGDRTHLPGYVSDPLPRIAGFDIALVPSVYPDPCPLA